MSLMEGGVIEVKNGERKVGPPTVYPSPLDLYSFLNLDNKFLSFNEINSTSSLWIDLDSRVSYVGTGKFLDRDCIVLRFSGSFDHHTYQKADYDVFVDPLTSIPLGWQAFDSKKHLIEQYEALDFKTIVGETNSISFTYPSHSRTTQYQWAGTLTGPNGVIKYYKSIRDEFYDDVQINSLSPNDLKIDRSLANAVLDLDSGVLSRIPK